MKSKENFINLSCISFSDIYFFRNKELIFSSLSSNDSSEYAKTVVFQCDSSLLDMILSFSSKKAYIYTENKYIHYGVLHFGDNLHCITGPFCIRKMDHQQTFFYTREHHIKNSAHYQIPFFSFHQSQALLKLIYKIYTGNNCDIVIELPSYNSPFASPEEDNYKTGNSFQTYRLNNAENDIHHHPYQYEILIRNYIKAGDYESIQRFFSNPSAASYSPGIMSHVSRKQDEYAVVTALHLFCDAAIEGGVSPYDAYDLSDLYLQKLSVSTDTSKYYQIFFEAIQDYVKIVKKAQETASLSIHVKKCKQYIIRHLNKQITLEQLADYVRLNPTYLSTLFHKTEGITIQNYIQAERIHAAENMLKYSDFSAAHIANYLCFQTQSYFGSIFKKYTGMTPVQYRKLNKPQEF